MRGTGRPHEYPWSRSQPARASAWPVSGFTIAFGDHGQAELVGQLKG